MNTSRDKERPYSVLKAIWESLLDEENVRSKEKDDDFFSLMLLLETALKKTKSLCSNSYNLKASNERVLSELDWKTKECNKLKLEIHRLENISCQKCSVLEAEMKSLKKRAVEAQNRMKSIANILKLGDNIEDSQSPRKNSALTIVSQMLSEESPRRKKRCLPKATNHWKETTVMQEDEVTLVPEALFLLTSNEKKASPVKKKDDISTITSPDVPFCSPKEVKSKLTTKLPPRNSESPNPARRNLSSTFSREAVDSPIDSIKIIPETEQNSMDLNGSLADYVKEANSELDKIWFTASSKPSSSVGDKNEISLLKEDTIVEITPEKSPLKRKTTWKLREVRGPAELAGSKKVRQMTLSLGFKNKHKTVDISKLSGFDGGSVSGSKEDKENKKDEFVIGERSSVTTEKKADNPDDSSDELIFSELGTNDFKPKATSTQIVKKDLITRKEKKAGSPNFKYRRDAVRKKSERAKLDGWDCANCAEYYAACGETSPSKVKSRMNKCSRHRDKFKPDTNTPPGYWNPIFPDTEECRAEGMYTSIHLNREE